MVIVLFGKNLVFGFGLVFDIYDIMVLLFCIYIEFFVEVVLYRVKDIVVGVFYVDD